MVLLNDGTVDIGGSTVRDVIEPAPLISDSARPETPVRLDTAPSLRYELGRRWGRTAEPARCCVPELDELSLLPVPRDSGAPSATAAAVASAGTATWWSPKLTDGTAAEAEDGAPALAAAAAARARAAVDCVCRTDASSDASTLSEAAMLRLGLCVALTGASFGLFGRRCAEPGVG